MRQARVLLVDDGRDSQRVLEQAFHSASERVCIEAARSRHEFLEAIQGGKYDCIVLDYDQPPYAASDLFADLDLYQPGVPRIVVSSSEQQSIVVRSMREGVADFLNKSEAMLDGTLLLRIEASIQTARSQRVERRVMNRRLRVLEQMAYVDHLTSLLNRAGAELALTRSHGGTDRRGSTSITFLDLDHFKRVNDHLGHCEGDRVLRETAAVIKGFLRGTDIAARWGGEEFLILRQSDNLTDAWIWADQVRRAIAERVKMPEGFPRQTVSVGVDVVKASELSTDSVGRADHAMYMAKEAGRDRVCTWAMVQAMNIAYDVGVQFELTLRDRMLAVVHRLWGEMGETQREHTGPHGRRVQELSHLVGQHFDECRGVIDDLDIAAEFHDIGKLGIPDSLLAAPRLLTDEERGMVREHTRFGAELLRACGASDLVINSVQRHHERFDEIVPCRPRAVDPAAVISACDATVAMLSDRPYSRRMEVPRVLHELKSASGSQFHPRVVDAIERHGIAYAESVENRK